MIVVAVCIGVGIGMSLATLVIVLLPRYQTPVERAISQSQAEVNRRFGVKGSILEPEDQTVSSWLNDISDEHKTT